MGLNYTFAGQTGPISLSTLDTALGDASVAGYKNKIIGGDFTTNPWQRGTTFTGIATASYSVDRWRITYVTSAVVDVLKTADAPTATQAGVYTQHCLHIDVTTADASIAAGDVFSVTQRIEGLNAASFGFGQSGTRNVTLSFWHKHTKTGTYCVSLSNSAANRSYVAEYQQNVTDTWERETITIPVDTSGTWLYDNGVGVAVQFCLASGSTFQAASGSWQAGDFRATSNQVNALDNVANNFKIALVQLEAGSVATPFETRSVGQELALCQRYYYRITSSDAQDLFGVASADSATGSFNTVQFPVTMRSAPASLDQTGTAGNYQIRTGGTDRACTSVPTLSSISTQNAALVVGTVGSGQTAGQSGFMYSTAASVYLGFSAEL